MFCLTGWLLCIGLKLWFDCSLVDWFRVVLLFDDLLVCSLPVVVVVFGYDCLLAIVTCSDVGVDVISFVECLY